MKRDRELAALIFATMRSKLMSEEAHLRHGSSEVYVRRAVEVMFAVVSEAVANKLAAIETPAYYFLDQPVPDYVDRSRLKELDDLWWLYVRKW